jgi:Ca-activated chloride channel homolog
MTRSPLRWLLLVVGALVIASGVALRLDRRLSLRGEYREARAIYNDGVAALEKRELEAAEKLLLEARSKAGVDPELRFGAAFNLGVAFAAHADKVKAEDTARALDLAGQALSWFGDALRQRPGDADAKQNQRILRARVQALSDELRKAEGKLEARIDAVIGEQRGVLDGARAAWLEIRKAGGADPLAQQPRLVSLADAERAIVAEVGAISDVAADEIDAIGKKPEEQRTDQEKVRVIQLRGVDIYLLEARARIAEARRKLQELATEDALGRAEAAMVALKRAREQLLDPITVMRHVARDELELVQDTVAAGGGRGLELGATAPADPAAPRTEAVSPWLEPAVLAERQGSLRDRLEEVRARLDAAVAAPAQPPAEGAGEPPAPSPEQAKLLERVKLALPFVTAAVSAMDAARRALADRQLGPALGKEREALEALARAIEEFADLKQTIELAHGEQELISALLSPEGARLPAEERGKQTREALARNAGRAERLKDLIAEAVAQLAAQAAQVQQAAQQAQAGAGSAAGAGAGSAAPDPAAQAEAATQQLEAEQQKLARAEELRGQYRTALAELEKGLAAGQDPAKPAADARQHIAELRKLFFSVIEHLEQLIRDQGDTRDRTSEAHGADPLSREARLPELIGREEQHGAMAKAITDALAAQADAAAKQPPPQGAPDGKTLSAAADEVRHAQRAMTDAVAAVIRVRDARTSSESLEPALKSQGTAIEHLENALKLLQPPKQRQQQQDPQQDQQQQQEQQQQQQQQQQQRGGQAARDQDAQQQKKRRERESSREPIEKDW